MKHRRCAKKLKPRKKVIHKDGKRYYKTKTRLVRLKYGRKPPRRQ